MPTTVGTFPAAHGAEVGLQVIIGDGQEGGSSAGVGSVEVGSGDEIDTTLEAVPDLRGKMLVVSSVVKDRREETNHTSVTVRLRSAQIAREFSQEQIAEPGGLVNYLFVITFT